MSRIEEALKKAKASRNSLVVADSTDEEKMSRQLVAGRSMSVVKKQPSSMIKLMREYVASDNDELTRKGIILPDSSKSAVTDSFRYLRTQLLEKSKNNNFIVLITSCGGGEDSAFVSINLGAAFAFDESKTSLVIDCDFKTNTMDSMLMLEPGNGLIDFLEDDADVSDVLKDVGVKRLRFIPSGNIDHIESEYFTTERMRALLDGLVERYDDRYIFLNSPAINDSVDASILVNLVDYVIVVAPYGRTSTKELEAAIDRIDKSKLLGVILNDIPEWVKN